MNDQTVIKWAEGSLLRNGYTIQGLPESIRAMPWSHVTQFSTSEGFVYLKQMAPLFSIEPTLIQALQDLFFANIPEMIETNKALNCFLMKDAGMPLRDSLKDIFQTDLTWRALKVYADIQIQAIKHVNALLSLGVPDWRLAKLPGLYIQLISNEDMLASDGLTSSEIEALHRLQPKFSALCDLLSQYNIPETLEHGDFHDNNILLKKDHLTLNDWGDAVITHPFFSLASYLNSVTRAHGFKGTDERYVALQNAYLESWLDFGPPDQLFEGFLLTKRLRSIPFALNCSRVKKGATLASSFDFSGYICDSLRGFIKAETK